MVDVRAVFRIEAAQDVIDGFIFRGSDADFEAGVFIGAEGGDDRFVAVVAAGTALGFETDASDFHIEIVGNDEESIDGDAIALEQRADGLAADVHERHRLDEHDGMALDLTDADQGAFTVLADGDLVLVGELVDDFEADIVASPFVFGAWVAEADDEILRRVDGAAGLL